MQSTSSMTSKLLTLSVHEALTFDGVEIALHPELFSGTSGGIQGRHSRDVSFASTMQGRHTRDASFSSLGGVSRSGHVRDPTHPFSNNIMLPPPSPLVTSPGLSSSVPTYNINEISSFTGDVSHVEQLPNQSRSTLQAGDLIELRVWDAKPNESSISKDNQTPGKCKDILTDYINTKLNHSPSLEEGKHVLMAPSREKNPLTQTHYHSQSEQRRGQTERLPFVSAKPPIVPRGFSGNSSIGASPKIVTGYLSKSPSPPSDVNIATTSPGWTTLPPSKLPPFRGTDIKDSPKHQRSLSLLSPKKQHIHEFPSPPSLSSSLSEEGSVVYKLDTLSTFPERGSTKKNSNSGPVALLSDNTSQTIRGVKKELIKSEPTPISRMSSLDSSCSNAFAAAVQGTEEYQPPPSQKVPDMLDIISKTHNLRLMIVMVVTDKSLLALKNTSRIQVSLLRQVADLYDLSAYETKITVTKVDKSEEATILDSAQADFVTVTIKDQFISRGEMYQFSHFFVGSWIYAGERLVTDDGVRGNVMEIRSKISARPVKSGHVTKDTKITFRSCSARIIWLVQISSEMWDYAPPYLVGKSQGVSTPNGDRGCEIYFDRFVSFMHRLFDEWKELEVTHSLTVVFFSRTLISSKKKAHADNIPQHEHPYHESTIRTDADGRPYEDHFKVVVEEAGQGADWHSLVSKIKKAFVSYPSEVGWDLSHDLYRIPSTAAQGNILEAINTALNMLQLHYMDRDLRRSGNSVVVVSAGSGVFEVEKRLAGITKQRMMDNGIGSDMLSLGLPPLHVAPFFLYTEGSKPIPNKMHGFDGWKAFFEIPHWMHLSFISYDKSRRTAEASVEKRADGRNFEDILEACRPRNRGESSTRGVPSALLYRLKLIDQIKTKDGKTTVRTESVIYDGIHKISESYPKQSKVTSSLEEDKCPVREWGSVVFDETNGMSMIPKSITTISESISYGRSPSCETKYQIAASLNSDKSSPSSAGNFSSLHGHSPGMSSSPASNGLQIQKSTTIDIPLFTFRNGAGQLKTTVSTDSLSTMGNDDLSSSLRTCDIGPSSITRKMASIESLHKAMINYDNSVFAPVPKKIRDLHNDKSNTSIAGRISSEESVGETGGGIGAALVQYDSGQPLQEPVTTLKKKSMHTTTPSSLRFSKTMYSRSHSLGKSAEHHKKHEAVDGLRPRNVLLSTYSAHETLQQKIGSVPFMPGICHVSESSRINIQKKPVAGIMNTRPELSKKSVRSPERETMVSGQKYDRPKYKKKGKHFRKNTIHYSRQKSKSFHSKAWVLNPFRQEDEEEVLAKRTHNSRRWSHVFPKGEIEYKRHAGPNWKSLCQPAILPVTIDVGISSKELNDPHTYSLNHYEVILEAVDFTHYKSHSDLLKEMVKQRLIQDFQLVPESNLLQKNLREGDRNKTCVQHSVIPKSDSITSARSIGMQNPHLPHRSSTMPLSQEKRPIQHTLSMGHQVQVLTYDPTSDAVKVVLHQSKLVNSECADYRYNYMLWSSISSTYAPMSQKFRKYSEEYKWNMIDNLISGELEKKLERTKRYRRISFRIIPDNFDDLAGEEEYIKKIRYLLEFIEKKQVKKPCGIDIISSKNPLPGSNINQEGTKRKISLVKTFCVPLVKGKRDKYEWMEMVIDSTVDTRRTFRIMFHWLVANAIKVEAQVQLLARRCTKYGLRLVQFPHVSLSSSMHVHPFLRPEIILVKDQKHVKMVEAALIDTFEFVDDCKPLMCAENEKDLNVAFGLELKSVSAQQYVHQSGTNFIRLLQDNRGCTLFFFMENRKHTGGKLSEVARDIFYKVSQYVQNVQSQELNK